MVHKTGGIIDKDIVFPYMHGFMGRPLCSSHGPSVGSRQTVVVKSVMKSNYTKPGLTAASTKTSPNLQYVALEGSVWNYRTPHPLLS